MSASLIERKDGISVKPIRRCGHEKGRVEMPALIISGFRIPECVLSLFRRGRLRLFELRGDELIEVRAGTDPGTRHGNLITGFGELRTGFV